ncbi:MAG: hypothetical protein M0C28_41010 [Candidatus Moduliflexus flocculans]|nr:hypothetical protein [Candidatus Moduliflexus flocculans]
MTKLGSWRSSRPWRWPSRPAPRTATRSIQSTRPCCGRCSTWARATCGGASPTSRARSAWTPRRLPGARWR